MPRASFDRDGAVVGLDHVDALRRAPRRARAHQALDAPAGVAERLGRREAQPPGGAKHENLSFHAVIASAMIDRCCGIAGLQAMCTCWRMAGACGDWTVADAPIDHDNVTRFRRPRMVSRHLQWYWSRMTDVLVYALVPLALAAVAVVLLFGFINFARGGSPQTVAEADALARADAVRRARRYHADDLDHGT